LQSVIRKKLHPQWGMRSSRPPIVEVDFRGHKFSAPTLVHAIAHIRFLCIGEKELARRALNYSTAHEVVHHSCADAYVEHIVARDAARRPGPAAAAIPASAAADVAAAGRGESKGAAVDDEVPAMTMPADPVIDQPRLTRSRGEILAAYEAMLAERWAPHERSILRFLLRHKFKHDDLAELLRATGSAAIECRGVGGAGGRKSAKSAASSGTDTIGLPLELLCSELTRLRSRLPTKPRTVPAGAPS
jgi:hypothetical protein